MISVYTENLFLARRIRSAFKRWVARGRSSGPVSVYKALVEGLHALHIPVQVNNRDASAVACVLSGVKTLQWAIEQKKRGTIKLLLAGPNIVISPEDAQRVLLSDHIDAVLVPSEWVRQFYMHYGIQPEKIKVWAAGVSVPHQVHTAKKYDFLLYDKAENADMIQEIQHILKQQSFSYHTLKYGTFSRADYYKALACSRYLLYISPSESQGLAMFEAWAMDVPSLHWERGFYEYKGYRYEGRTSTPYVHPDVGMAFTDVIELSKILATFVGHTFFPKRYILNGFTQVQSAQHLLSIIDSFAK